MIAGAPGRAPAHVEGIHHLGLSVTDLGATEWYREAFGLDVVGEIEGHGFRRTRLRSAGGTTLTLTCHADGSDDAFDERRPGLDHVAFQVAPAAGLEELVARLDALPPATRGSSGATGGGRRSPCATLTGSNSRSSPDAQAAGTVLGPPLRWARIAPQLLASERTAARDVQDTPGVSTGMAGVNRAGWQAGVALDEVMVAPVGCGRLAAHQVARAFVRPRAGAPSDFGHGNLRIARKSVPRTGWACAESGTSGGLAAD